MRPRGRGCVSAGPGVSLLRDPRGTTLACRRMRPACRLVSRSAASCSDVRSPSEHHGVGRAQCGRDSALRFACHSAEHSQLGLLVAGAGVGSPPGGGHHAGLHQLQPIEEPGDRIGGAQDIPRPPDQRDRRPGEAVLDVPGRTPVIRVSAGRTPPTRVLPCVDPIVGGRR